MSRPKYPSDEVDKTLLRFPPGLRDRIRAEAEANGRSLNSEIVARLEASFSSDTLTAARMEYRKVDELLEKIEKLLEQNDHLPASK